jgi:hypothetical protein
VNIEQSVSHALTQNEKMYAMYFFFFFLGFFFYDFRFIFDGIAVLMSETLVLLARYIKRLNNDGVEKLIKSVFALQQNLSNITLYHETRLDRAKRYFELFRRGGPVTVE